MDIPFSLKGIISHLNNPELNIKGGFLFIALFNFKFIKYNLYIYFNKLFCFKKYKFPLYYPEINYKIPLEKNGNKKKASAL